MTPIGGGEGRDGGSATSIDTCGDGGRHGAGHGPVQGEGEGGLVAARQERTRQCKVSE